MPRNSGSLAAADALLGDGLADLIRRHRDTGQSWERIARLIHRDTAEKVEVSGEAVRKWALRHGVGADAKDERGAA